MKDCHYCENALCMDANSDCACFADDGYFDHHVFDSKEAETCESFVYSDIFPKT